MSWEQLLNSYGSRRNADARLRAPTTLPGSNSRLLRGYALHRSYPITSKPLPPRAMLLMTLHPLDTTTYEPADIEPYVV